ncbi:MAG: hypothetical protein KZQ77_05575 [Candidatus Thiodiazotropha sp. (ex Notomyrtea botanica)]|nr:hypothetical protein [Candidatus Thiodiazotropha sp. (ex Notomyrtea botanica)]
MNKTVRTSLIGLVACLVPVVWLTHGHTVQAADREYLLAVEADVAEFDGHVFEIPSDSPWVGSDSQAPILSGGQNGGLDSFSVFIESKSPGSYIFYKKLPEVYKMRLHQDYLTTGDLDRVKDDIFRYTKELK